MSHAVNVVDATSLIHVRYIAGADIRDISCTNRRSLCRNCMTHQRDRGKLTGKIVFRNGRPVARPSRVGEEEIEMGSSLHLANPAERSFIETPTRSDEHSSGVSWSAVIGGAFVAAAISLIMLALGAGFGLSAISPWSSVGASASEVGSVAIAWLIVTQVVACALGGYLAGRLRTKWAAVHTDEVYFRDTANGFLVWAVGLVITVIFLVSSASSLVGSAQQTRLAAGKEASDPKAYFVDRLFRMDAPSSQPLDASVAAEAARILANTLIQKDSGGADVTYLGKLVAARTGVSQPDADQRVSLVLAAARQAEDTVRRTTSHLLLWIFLALLMGAFSASLAATIGGKQRDNVKVK
jgi:hypothetical protein